MTKSVSDLTQEQKERTTGLSKKELDHYLFYLFKRNYIGGTVEEWATERNRKDKIKLKKINELTPEQQKGVNKGLTNDEVAAYITWLSKRNYSGGSVPEWQAERIKDFNTRKATAVVERGSIFGPTVYLKTSMS